jgi:putative transposase
LRNLSRAGAMLKGGVQLEFIRPGKPLDDGYIESFNGRLRDECLSVEIFSDPSNVREKLERWRPDYNQAGPTAR